jgi:hypothetical protein
MSGDVGCVSVCCIEGGKLWQTTGYVCSWSAALFFVCCFPAYPHACACVPLLLLAVVVNQVQAAVLQGGRVGPEFFAALSRVRAIHEHCK